MFVYLLTSSLLVLPLCMAFSDSSREESIRPWFVGTAGGLLLVLAEIVVRAVVRINYVSPLLFLKLAARETSVPIVVAVGLFFASRYRNAEPAAQELGLAAFLSGAFTLRSLYHALFVAEAVNVYWSFLSPTVMVSAILLVPPLIRWAREAYGVTCGLAVASIVLLVLAYTLVPFLYELHFHVLSIFVAAVAGAAGLGAWVGRPLLARSPAGGTS